MMDMDTIEKFKQQKLAEDVGYKAQMKHIIMETQKLEKEAIAMLKGKIVPATKEDYEIWLSGYIGNGKEPTHYYDYPMTRVLDSFFLAIDHFEIGPLYGSSSINILVPESVEFLGGKLGHTNLYMFKDYKNKGIWVPVYEDTII